MDLGHESGNNKVSETQRDNADWSQNSKRTHPQVIEWSKRSNPFAIDFEVIDGNKSRKHSTEGHAIRGSESIEQYPKIIDGNLRSTVIKDDQICQTKRSGSFSSSDSELSSEDLSQIDVIEFVKPREHINTQPTSELSENDIPISNSFKSEECDVEYSGITTSSQASAVTHESLVQNTSLTQSPPVQVMERSGGYDPSRIPSSVFDRNKSITPMDWSVASNESLFSINVGNNSFSRDHVLMFGDLTKSGELIKSEELIVFSLPPPIRVAEIDRKNVEIGKQSEAYGIPNRNHDAELETENYVIEPQVSSVSSRQSNGSETSYNSFCFPVKRCCAWSSCYRSNCSWTFCHFRLPRCHFRWTSCCCCCFNCSWPSCKCCHCNCSWTFCYGWNCSRKRCYSSSTLREEERTASLKEYANPKQPHFQLPISEAHSKSSSKKHSHCFCCLPHCCCCSLPRCSCCLCCSLSCC